MAEEEIEPRDPNYDGPFSTITLNEQLFSLAGGSSIEGGVVEPMSAADMRRFVLTKVMVSLQDEGLVPDDVHDDKYIARRQEAEHLAKEIVAWMPKGAMYQRVIENLDLRPFVQTWGAGQGIDTEAAQLSDEALVALNGDVKRTIEATNANNTVNNRMSPEELAKAAELQSKFSPSIAGLAPTSVLTDAEKGYDAAVAGGQMTAEEANEALYSDDPLAALDEDPIATINFPVADMERAMRTGEITDIMGLAEADQEWVRQALDANLSVDPSTSFTPVDLGMRAVEGAGGVPGEYRPQNVVLNAVDAMDYLDKLTVSQVEAMQRSLARAGYMNNDEGLTYEPGDKVDPLTVRAWQLALFDSAQTQTALPKLLVDRSAKEDRLKAERAKLDDETMFRTGVNGMVRQALGRDLSQVEYEQVRGYITTLATERAAEIPGLDQRGWEGTTYANEMYGENDVTGAVEKVIGGQAASRSSYNAGQKLFQIIGRDFPGTQRVED